MRRILSLWIALGCAWSVWGQTWNTPPLSTTPPPFPTIATAQPPSAFWAADLLSAPLPTNRWWQNIVLGDGTATCNALPYLFQSHPEGLKVCMPERVAGETFVISAFVPNWTLSATEIGMGQRQIVDFDDLSVTLSWPGGMTTPIVRGMSSVTAAYDNATPVLSTIHAILSVNGLPPGTVTSDRFEMPLNNGSTWVVHALEGPVTATVSGGSLTFDAPYSGAVRLTVLAMPGVATLPAATVDAHIGAYPIGGTMDATINGDDAEMAFDWEVAGEPGLAPLMFALPHHQEILANDVVPSLEVTTIKGVMRGVIGEEWVMNEPLPTIDFAAPGGIPEHLQPSVAAALADDIDFPVTAGDTYFGGKQLAAIGRLALIADELGETALASTARANLANALNPWLNGTNSDPLRYDAAWGGVVSSSGGSFGMGLYNDHHFHFGYFLYAAAALAKEDPNWLAANAETINHIARNIANPSANDPHYTQARNKDWFVGHSWAAGLYAFGDGRNQESSSEAVNAWYGLHLWGLVSGQTDLSNLARLLLATEIRSTQRYWQIDSNDGIYPEPFAANKVVGVLWSTKVDYGTFFGGNTEFIHGIQMLPFTPITASLLEPAWVEEEYPVVAEALDSPTLAEGWRGFIYMTHAILDPVTAWDEVLTLEGHDDGNTLTNTLYWVATRPGAEAIDPGEVNGNDAEGVTFAVDMNGEDLLDGSVYITGGSIDGWCGTCTAMTDSDGDGIFEATLDLPPGPIEYKFVNGNWDAGEILDPLTDGACTLTTGEFTNRYFDVPSDGNAVLPIVCFNSCNACDPLVDCPSDTNNNGICDTDDIPGCTYPAAANFDPAATMDNGSCVYDAGPLCPGDLNSDGVVSVTDLLALLGVFGEDCP